MILLDLPTAYLLLGLLYVLMPSVTWIMLSGQRALPVALWCGGGLLIAAPATLGVFTAKLPQWATVELAPLLFYLSQFMRIQALRLDLNLPPRLRTQGAVLLGLFLVSEFLTHGLQSAVMRAQFNSLAWAVLLFYIAWLATRIARSENSRSARWIAGVYGLLGAAFLFRAYAYLGSQTTSTVLTTEGLSGQLIALAGILSAVIGHIGYVGLALDRATRRAILAASETARAEENLRLGKQIAQLNRQRSLGEMSASLGHELNQPLTAILSNAQVAKRGLALARFDPPQLTDFLDKIIQNTQRASQIIERIRGFIRPAAVRREPVDLLLVIYEVVALVADEARSRKVTLHLPPAHPELQVTGDAILLSQVILNILRNAIQALDQVAQREIRIGIVRDGNRARLHIHDNGPGLAAEVLAQAGTPFFTTKPDGLGMGLTISRSIVEQHGGTLTLTNAVGGGALVTIDLPALPAINT